MVHFLDTASAPPAFTLWFGLPGHSDLGHPPARLHHCYAQYAASPSHGFSHTKSRHCCCYVQMFYVCPCLPRLPFKLIISYVRCDVRPLLCTIHTSVMVISLHHHIYILATVNTYGPQTGMLSSLTRSTGCYSNFSWTRNPSFQCTTENVNVIISTYHNEALGDVQVRELLCLSLVCMGGVSLFINLPIVMQQNLVLTRTK
jgi:hypothetical protein